jgi:hypothetical protein
MRDKKEATMVSKVERIVFAVSLLFAGPLISVSDAQQTPTKIVQLTGLVGVKDKTKGTLAVENGNLHFVYSKGNSDVAATSIQDVVTGSDSQRAIRGTVGTLTMIAPYGSGRFMSLFRSKIDTLTIQYRDADGGLHGAIFSMPVGTAELIKKELTAHGAHTSIPTQADPSTDSSKPSNAKEQKQ